MSERKFAYGQNEIGEASCPAVTAGCCRENAIGKIVPKGPILEYDDRFCGDGVVREEKAKEAWFEAILTELEIYHRDPYKPKGALEQAQEGVEVAKELGWL